MSDVFKALADPTRREILLMLVQQPGSIGTLCTKFDMSRTAVAKHVRILSNSNLVRIEQGATDARQAICYAQLDALKDMEDYMKELQGFWESKLAGLGQYLSKNK